MKTPIFNDQDVPYFCWDRKLTAGQIRSQLRKSATKSAVKCLGIGFLHLRAHFVATLNRTRLPDRLKRFRLLRKGRLFAVPIGTLPLLGAGPGTGPRY